MENWYARNICARENVTKKTTAKYALIIGVFFPWTSIKIILNRMKILAER